MIGRKEKFILFKMCCFLSSLDSSESTSPKNDKEFENILSEKVYWM